MDFPDGSDSKEFACNAGDLGSIPELGRSVGGGHGNPLQYSCLENPNEQRSLAGCHTWDCEGSYKTEQINTAQHSTSASLMVQMVKNPSPGLGLLDWEDPLEKGMATHSSILALSTFVVLTPKASFSSLPLYENRIEQGSVCFILLNQGHVEKLNVIYKACP